MGKVGNSPLQNKLKQFEPQDHFSPPQQYNKPPQQKRPAPLPKRATPVKKQQQNYENNY
jgi:hypothetical protein